jgi:CBS domain-containing protein
VYAADIMTAPVLTVQPDTEVTSAAQVMSEHAITSLPVLDADGRIVGIVSEADIITDRLPHDPRSHPRPEQLPQPDPARRVGQVMREFVICVCPQADTADLAAVMLDNNVRAVPITDGAALVGIVSRRDLLKTLLRKDNDVCAQVEQRLRESGGARDHLQVSVNGGVVTISGRFEDDGQQLTVETLTRTVPGVLRVHTRHRRFR